MHKKIKKHKNEHPMNVSVCMCICVCVHARVHVGVCYNMQQNILLYLNIVLLAAN